MSHLSPQEQQWILTRQVTRLTDNKEVQIYPMGAERYLSSVLLGEKPARYNMKADIEGKNVLVIPGYGNSAFLLAQAGAHSVTVYDKDPVTIAWIKAFKKYYHFREHSSYPSIGELLTALTKWYPPLIRLPSGHRRNAVFWLLQPNSLRRIYIHYMLSLTQQAIRAKKQEDVALAHTIEFHTGTLHSLLKSKEQLQFDSAFVPYLLGIRNGIEQDKEIVTFIKQLTELVPHGNILVTPSRATKEFYITGKRYFVTTNYKNIQSIPGLQPYFKLDDKYWFRTQGYAVFCASTKSHS